ncbi:unnamed protein product [Closterium sp. Naga37s-1]|nr:unnamed protein product [Closterium sp. Naga37s-1]
MLLGNSFGSHATRRFDSWLNGTFVNRLGRDSVRRCVGHECERGGAAPGAWRREGEGARVTGARGRVGPAAAAAVATATRAGRERTARGAGTGADGLAELRGRGGGEAEGRARGGERSKGGERSEGGERGEGGERSEAGSGEGMVAQGPTGGACDREQREEGAAGREAGGKPRVIVISGPTAVGKSRLALAVAEAVRGGEVVSADSVAVYRSLNVGSAKPSPAHQRRVPHHLLDICEPWQGEVVTGPCSGGEASKVSVMEWCE